MLETGGQGTLLSIGVKVADKDRIGSVMKFVKISLKLLLGIVLEVLSTNKSTFL